MTITLKPIHIVAVLAFIAGIAVAGAVLFATGGSGDGDQSSIGDGGTATAVVSATSAVATTAEVAATTKVTATSTTEPEATLAPTTAPTSTSTPPPTATATPAVTWAKFYDIFRAEGGGGDQNETTSLPLRRLDWSWDNSYRQCPPQEPNPDCIRGAVSATTATGPLAIGQRLESSAFVYNTFTAQTTTADIEMAVNWSVDLFTLVALDVYSGATVRLTVFELNSAGEKLRTLPGFPVDVFARELSQAEIRAVSSVEEKDGRVVTQSMQLQKGTTYRIELEAACRTRNIISGSASTCHVDAEWTSLAIVYETGICGQDQGGPGCIYPPTPTPEPPATATP